MLYEKGYSRLAAGRVHNPVVAKKYTYLPRYPLPPVIYSCRDGIDFAATRIVVLYIIVYQLVMNSVLNL